MDKMNEFQTKMKCLKSRFIESAKELLECVDSINSANYNDLIINAIKCLAMQKNYSSLKLNWVEMSNIETSKDKHRATYLKYDSFLRMFRYRDHEVGNYIRTSGWYFFVKRATGSIDYIGVGGTKTGKLNSYNDLYHRISQHFGTGSGATFFNNYYRDGDVPSRENWVKTLKENYDLMVIYAKEGDIGEDDLYVVESFFNGIFQPKYNRQ